MDGGAVRDDRGVAAIAAPGEWIGWNLRRAPNWPAQVRASLKISYSAFEPVNAGIASGSDLSSGYGQMRIFSAENGKLLLHRRAVPDLLGWKTGLAPGLYYLHVRNQRGGSQWTTLLRAP